MTMNKSLSSSFRDWASKIRGQYNKHYRETEIRDSALEAVEDILEKIKIIPDNSVAYVEKLYYNSFFERFCSIVFINLTLTFDYLYIYFLYYLICKRKTILDIY